jgi:hypothetical protein
VTETTLWPWAGLLALGAWHGINPAMGWLFAVALGMQEESQRAVWRALGPLALGHALAVGAAVLTAALIGSIVPRIYLQQVVAALLVAFGLYRMFRRTHPRWVGMRVSARDLTFWSALMATAHGAGLMVLPFALGAGRAADSDAAEPITSAPHHGLASNAAIGPSLELAAAGWAALVHTGSYLLVTGAVAVIVYQKLGLRLLRRTWLNLDLIWAGALIMTGVLTLFL